MALVCLAAVASPRVASLSKPLLCNPQEREHKKTEAQPIVQRAPLQRRTEDLQLARYVGGRQVVTGAQAIAGEMSGTYHCKVCDCVLRDHQNYLLHINGRKHNRMLGMSMRAERSTVEEVRARLDAHKAEQEAAVELSADEKASLFLQHFDERIKQRGEEERDEKREKRREKKEREREKKTVAEATGGGEEEDAMAAMGFAGFGGSRKNN